MKGFTLIEMIVTVAISLVVTGFIIVNYNSYNDVQTLKQTALTLKNNLRFAQSKAATGEKPTSGCTELSGYSVSFPAGAKAYSIGAICNPEGAVGEVTSIDLPNGVTFSPVPSSIIFNVLSRGVTPGSGLCIVLSGSGKSYSLGVSANGEINDFGLEYSGQCP